MPEQLYRHQPVRIWARIEGIDEDVDVTEFRATYQLNAIPTAWLNFPMGRSVPKGRVSGAHELAEGLKEAVGVTVRAKVGKKEVQVFEGKAVAESFQRSPDSLGFSIDLLHWANGLNNSSALSSGFVAGTPLSLVRPLAMAQFEGAAEPTPDQRLAGLNLAGPNFVSDVWGACQKILTFLTKSPDPVFRNFPDLTATLVPTATTTRGNEVATDILKNRMVSSPATRMQEDLRRYSVEMAKQAGEICFTAAGGPTIWSKLMNLSQLFRFTIVPTAHTLYVVPFVPFYNPPGGAVTLDILPSEYDFVQKQAARPVPIRQVIMLGLAVLEYGNRKDSQLRGLGASVYDVAGRTMFIESPAWLNHVASASPAGGVLGHRPAETAVLAADPEDDQPASTVAARLAKSIHLSEGFGHRSSDLSANLRFDIVPGRPVRLVIPGDSTKFHPEQQLDACVTGLTIHASAAKSRAGVTYQIGGIRTAAERELGMPTHPLYTDAFTGDGLVVAR